MKYHAPEKIWTAFGGVKDYDSFLEKMVVAGRFHAAVPSEVVEAYATAEHIMAHAWYHYPAMDEALVKLLRILEMAVKLRCEQLNIDLTFPESKGKTRKKELVRLINELAGAEPEKGIKEILHRLREIRNYLMHPDKSMMLGIVSLNFFKPCIIMLNALFLPKQFFQDAKAELERVRPCCQIFEKGLFVLEHTVFRYIVHRFELVEAYFSGGKWLVLCAFHAVPADFQKMLSENHLVEPLVYLVKDFGVGDGKISGIVMACGEPFELSKNEHPENLARLADFEKLKSEMDEHQKFIFSLGETQKINRMKTEARFDFWSV